jgi:hypothetical protein
MFILVTAITLWGLLISDSAILNHPIPMHSLNSLLIFFPSSWQGLLLCFLWSFATVAVLIVRSVGLVVARLTGQTPIPTKKPQASFFKQLGAFAHMRVYLVLLLFTTATGVGGWILGIEAALMFGGILTLGLVGNLIEQA